MVMTAGEISGTFTTENRPIVKERVAPAASARNGFRDGLLDGPADELTERDAGGVSAHAGEFLEAGRQDDGGSLHNYVYIII
jgi:hypothetical protein